MKNTQPPKVAVLMAAYNGEKYIKKQIESIFNQLNVEIHIYISIDKSTDQTLEICKKLKETYKNLTILNKGSEIFGSAGKNFFSLIKNVDFELFQFISFSDQDDIWIPEKISRGIEILEKEQASGYSSDVECFWDKKNKKNKIIKKSYPQKKYDYLFEPAGPGCTYILEKEFAKTLQEKVKQLHSLPFHHDWYIYALARSEKYKWYIDDKPNILYRQHSFNQVGANIGLKSLKKRLILLKNKTYKKQHEEILSSINTSFDSKKIKYLINKNPFEFRRKKTEAIALFLINKLNLV